MRDLVEEKYKEAVWRVISGIWLKRNTRNLFGE